MPEKTLLDYTQDILSALDSDEVNSINDTVESLQVARILKRTYDSIVSRADLLEHYTLFQLTPSTDINLPCVMYRPDDVDNIIWIKYDGQTTTDTNVNYSVVEFMPLDSFVAFINNLDETEDFVGTQTVEDMTFKFRNDGVPKWYTTYNDSTLIFDSYDVDVDTTLQESKTQCYGKKDQTWTNTDAFVPFLDLEFQSLLLNESLVVAFAELKQVPNEVAKMWASRAWTKLSKSKRGVDNDRRPIDNQVNYGRRRH